MVVIKNKYRDAGTQIRPFLCRNNLGDVKIDIITEAEVDNLNNGLGKLISGLIKHEHQECK